MSICFEKCSRIRHIVRLRQMLRRWRTKAACAARISAAGNASSNLIPSDVPAGHVAVCVGTNSRRFVVRASYLNHPVFKKLLIQAEEEYGFSNHGPLAIPCDESVFEEILRFLTRTDSGRSATLEDFKRCSRNLDFWPESRPLLRGISEKSVW
ncbi:indole-3-acetic acid-induced protein ARG7 [Magnolia sinica]|uniref:indole-3-acetic acid-induced protein ARG7 n=1 Tax=Magnolia sinica TaxID=86752 RepID=UPI002658C667|nr:indole-3-acetic acid-induced protein ARG7 [Magnolia sinica]